MADAKNILLVEDDPNFGIVLRDYLNLNGFQVTLAKNGMEGFDKYKKGDYDLCILDVMMPYKDGYTLAKEIREDNTSVPIIFLTAKSMKEDVLQGYKVGADDFLNKPFDSEVLLAKIKTLLKRKSSQTTVSQKQTDFKIGDFHLNAKLRFLTWRDDNYFTSRSMDVYIAKLRKYLKQDPKVEILNIHGEGFRLVVHA